MHMSKLYPGHLHIASNNHTGRVYKDWRKKYIRKAGALMIEYLDSVPNKGEAYLFLKDLPGEHLHTSIGDVQITDDIIHIRTSRSLYIFFIEPECLTDEDMKKLKKRTEKYL